MGNFSYPIGFVENLIKYENSMKISMKKTLVVNRTKKEQSNEKKEKNKMWMKRFSQTERE